jgi:hypothetical protein
MGRPKKIATWKRRRWKIRVFVKKPVSKLRRRSPCGASGGSKDRTRSANRHSLEKSTTKKNPRVHPGAVSAPESGKDLPPYPYAAAFYLYFRLHGVLFSYFNPEAFCRARDGCAAPDGGDTRVPTKSVAVSGKSWQYSYFQTYLLAGSTADPKPGGTARPNANLSLPPQSTSATDIARARGARWVLRYFAIFMSR